jgi:hypothetical protein
MEFSDHVHGPDRLAPDEENREFRRVCKTEEEWSKDLGVG